jgi:hypothetical protein
VNALDAVPVVPPSDDVRVEAFWRRFSMLVRRSRKRSATSEGASGSRQDPCATRLSVVVHRFGYVAEVIEGTAARAGVPERKVLRPFVRDALAAPTGPELLSGLGQLMGRDDLSARELVELSAGWRRMRSFCDAAELTTVAELAQRMSTGPDAVLPGRTDPLRPAADELAPALRIAPQTASRLVGLAVRTEALPAAMDALLEGRMDLPQLKILDQIVRDLPAAAARTVVAQAVARAPHQTAAQLRADLAAFAQEVDPDHAAVAAERGVEERDVAFRPSPLPGCGRLAADVPWLSGTAAWNALNTAAKLAKKRGTRPDGTVEDRTLAQLRADILTAVLTGQHDPLGGHVPTPAELAKLAEVQVVVAADTLTNTPSGTANDTGTRTELPAHIPGVGPLDVATARAVATVATWRRLLADPATGELLAIADRVLAPVDGVEAIVAAPRWQALLTDPVRASFADDGTTYRPSPRLRRYVQTRDDGCIGPACHHPAAGTHLDHTIDHHEGGPTSADNLGPECERVHNAKTHGGWRLRQPRPGWFEWTSPTGRTYQRAARPLIPGWKRARRARRERPPPTDGLA